MRASIPTHYRARSTASGCTDKHDKLRLLTCNFCSLIITRLMVQPGSGPAVANRMRGLMQAHVRQYHPETLSGNATAMRQNGDNPWSRRQHA